MRTKPTLNCMFQNGKRRIEGGGVGLYALGVESMVRLRDTSVVCFFVDNKNWERANLWLTGVLRIVNTRIFVYTHTHTH